MITIPAIDLRDGACVQLVGGSYAHERVRLDDPRAVARRWAEAGFARLHVVDLDAATGAGNNDAVVEQLIRESRVPVQVGGGVRSDERLRGLLDMGAARVIVGTRAIEDLEWLDSVSTANPGRVIVAADVRERCLLTHGWARAQARDIRDFVADISPLPLAALLVTAVHREGRLLGPDLPLMHEIARASDIPLIASGGVSSLDDLTALAERGVSAAVVGMALYTGAIDARPAAIHFGQ